MTKLDDNELKRRAAEIVLTVIKARIESSTDDLARERVATLLRTVRDEAVEAEKHMVQKHAEDNLVPHDCGSCAKFIWWHRARAKS